MEPEFLDLMPATVQVRRRTGTDQFGNPAYTDPVAWRCRIDKARRRVGEATAGVIQWRTVIDESLIGPYVDPPWDVGDQITMPTGSVVTVGNPTDVTTMWDETGPHHLVVSITAKRTGS